MERGDCADRGVLHGLGEEILILVVQHAPPAQLTDWLKLPLELSEGDADFLLKPNECCQVRRKGEEVLTVVMERASSKQWCKWLQIPLEHAQRAQKALLFEQLLAAGATPNAINMYRASVNASPGARGGASGGNGGRRGVGKMAGCSPRVRMGTVRSSCCKPPEDTPAATVSAVTVSAVTISAATASATTAAAAAATASAASQRSCCPDVVPPADRRERRPRCGLPAERRETSSAASSGAAERDLPLLDTVIDVDGAAALVNSDKLHRATMARDLVRMRQILDGGVDRDATDLWSCTALHRAAEQDDAEPVRLLLAAGLDVRARDMEGYSPLHFASARGATTAIVDLLAAGSCLSDRGLNGDTPLHSAVRFLSLPTVRILLSSGADENAKNCEGHTPADVTGVLPDGREIENQPDPLMAQSILTLLAAAPAERKLRAWKRRAWLVILRARAQAEVLEAPVDLGVRVAEAVGPTLPADHAAAEIDSVDDALCCALTKCCGSVGDANARGVSGGAVKAGAVADDVVSGGDNGCGGGGAGVVEEKGGVTDSELSNLVDQTTGLAEEGLFQKIVRFL